MLVPIPPRIQGPRILGGLGLTLFDVTDDDLYDIDSNENIGAVQRTPSKGQRSIDCDSGSLRIFAVNSRGDFPKQELAELDKLRLPLGSETGEGERLNEGTVKDIACGVSPNHSRANL